MNIFKQIGSLFAIELDDDTILDPIKVTRLGFGSDCTAMAFNPEQSLIAIGTSTGDCFILGKQIDKRLQYPRDSKNAPILKLEFKVGGKQLIGINSENQILLWDLINQTLSISIGFKDPILDIQLSIDSPWLIIAFQTNKVSLMDCQSTRMSEYVIPIDLNMGIPLLQIQVNPSDLNQLLLGYENETIIWDFNQKRPIERYVLGKTTCICWKPDGTALATGYDDGNIAIWTTKKKFFQSNKSKMKPIHTKQLSQAITGFYNSCRSEVGQCFYGINFFIHFGRDTSSWYYVFRDFW